MSGNFACEASWGPFGYKILTRRYLSFTRTMLLVVLSESKRDGYAGARNAVQAAVGNRRKTGMVPWKEHKGQSLRWPLVGCTRWVMPGFCRLQVAWQAASDPEYPNCTQRSNKRGGHKLLQIDSTSNHQHHDILPRITRLNHRISIGPDSLDLDPFTNQLATLETCIPSQ